MFCHVPASRVINVYDCSSVWKVPLLLMQEGMLDIFRERLGVKLATHESVESRPFIHKVQCTARAQLSCRLAPRCCLFLVSP